MLLVVRSVIRKKEVEEIENTRVNTPEYQKNSSLAAAMHTLSANQVCFHV